MKVSYLINMKKNPTKALEATDYSAFSGGLHMLLFSN